MTNIDSAPAYEKNGGFRNPLNEIEIVLISFESSGIIA